MAKIFVSHSSRDKALVDEFIDKILRLGCNVPPDEIYCSSKEGMKTRPGEIWVRDLKHKMQGAKVILLLLSPNYYDSVYCLAELGATWVLDNIRVYPIVIPPLDISKIEGVIQELQSGMINSDEHLDNLREMISEVAELPIKNLADWTKQRKTFIDTIDTLLAPSSPRVSPSDLKRSQEQATVYRQERDEAKKEIKRLGEYIHELEKLKDHEDVTQAKFESLEIKQQFEVLTENISQSLRGLPKAARYALYYWNKNEPLRIPIGGSYDSADEAVDRGFLFWDEDTNGYRPVQRDSIIKNCQAKITALSDFLEVATEDFYSAFEGKYGYEADLLNLRFWEDHLIPRY